MKRRLRQERGHGLSLPEDQGRSLVGDSENERTRTHAGRFPLAQGENGRTGGIGNREGVREVFFPFLQRVEWQEMQRTMGHDNEVLTLEKWPQGGDEFAIERFQMTMYGPQKGLFKSPHVFTTHPKLRQL